MTGENRGLNAAAELARAEECLREAETLRDAGLPFGAASRAYYAVFHAATALLFSVGLEAKSHRAVASMIGEHFVKPGRLSAELGRLVAHMQRDREDADYATGAVFTADHASTATADATRFLAETRRILAG